MKYCPYCGTKLQVNVKSCPSCGRQLVAAGAPQQFGGGFVSGWQAATEQDASGLDAQYVTERLGQGEDKGRVAKGLVKRGWAKETAEQFVDDIDVELKRYLEEHKGTPEGRQAMAAQYKRRMLFGFLWAAGGTAVTIVTYEAAGEGGVFLIAWGAIIFGIVDFLRGLFGWLKYRD